MPRRLFLKTAAAVSGAVVTTGAAADAPSAGASDKAPMRKTFELFPIGHIEARDNRYRLHIDDAFKDGLLGLSDWSHVLVFYWFDQNDTPQLRRRLQVHPRGNRENPLTGVFACRSPFRPNLIALSVCKIVSVKGTVVEVDHIDAFDGSPLLDLKPFTPQDMPPAAEVRVPAWARRQP